MLTSFPKNERYLMWLLSLLSKRKCVDFSAFYDVEKPNTNVDNNEQRIIGTYKGQIRQVDELERFTIL